MTTVNGQRGSLLVLTALLITALLGFGALAVDAVYLMTVRSELQNTADAAALAATTGLTTSQAEAGQRASTYTALNPVLGTQVALEGQKVALGQWDDQRSTFVETNQDPNGVRVTLNLTDTSTPPAPALFFAPILGEQTGKVGATATAALGTRNIMVVLDRSNSMNIDTVPGGPKQPITDTKNAAKAFLNLIATDPILGDRAGLVSYNGKATLDNLLTDDIGQVQQAIDGIEADDSTNIAMALCLARRETLSERADPRAVKVIVLLSDGITNTRIVPATCGLGSPRGVDDPSDPWVRAHEPSISVRQAIDQAQLIANDGTILYTISLGADADQPFMKQIAELTGGVTFYAPTAADLQAIFAQISAKIPMRLVE